MTNSIYGRMEEEHVLDFDFDCRFLFSVVGRSEVKDEGGSNKIKVKWS